MKTSFILATTLLLSIQVLGCERCKRYNANPDFKITDARVRYNKALGQLEFAMEVSGRAGNTTPKPAGKTDGAPVLAYVFPTSLRAEDVGFSQSDGVVALALTSHPDFDDTPLWDENADGLYDNDGVFWHSHWVVLVKDDRVKGGLSVKQFNPGDKAVKLPPTAPSMPMYMDSPGFAVVTDGNTIRVSVPAYRINNKTDFSFDAVTCYLEVNSSAEGHGKSDMPMLGVYNVFTVRSGDLSLPYKVL